MDPKLSLREGIAPSDDRVVNTGADRVETLLVAPRDVTTTQPRATRSPQSPVRGILSPRCTPSTRNRPAPRVTNEHSAHDVKSFRPNANSRRRRCAAGARSVTEELSLGYAVTAHTDNGPTMDASDMLLGGVTGSAAFPLRRAPIGGRLVGGDTTKICKGGDLTWLETTSSVIVTAAPATRSSEPTSFTHPGR
jgi:hypothetical protein